MEQPLLSVAGHRARWRLARPPVLIGIGCVIVGGLVAAVTSPLSLENGSWAAAYLVLVAGVAQVGLAAGQAWLPARPPTIRLTMWELAAWNGGNAAVLAATLAGTPLFVAVGGLSLLVALVLFVCGAKGPRAGTTRWLATYRLGVGVLVISVPVGLVVSVLRHG